MHCYVIAAAAALSSCCVNIIICSAESEAGEVVLSAAADPRRFRHDSKTPVRQDTQPLMAARNRRRGD